MSLVVNDILKFREYVGDAWKNLLLQANMDFNLIYPVGSIYMSTNNTNPALLFGGTWQQLEDRFLLGAGTNYTAGDTGGAASHTLTVNNLPAHQTSGEASGYGLTQSSAFVNRVLVASTDAQAVSNMPPYLVVYMWKRLTLAPHLPYPTNVMTDIGEVATAFSIPASGSSVSYNMTGMTNEYELVKWNFSSSPENIPPVNLTCTTYDGYFTVTNNGGTTSETIKPMFIKAKKIAVTVH